MTMMNLNKEKQCSDQMNNNQLLGGKVKVKLSLCF